METVSAAITWDGPDVDVLRIWVEPTPTSWEADPIADDIAIFRVLDDQGQETDQIAGVEIIGFLGFHHWDDLPNFDVYWILGEDEPLPLDHLLKREQQVLRQEAGAPVQPPASAPGV